MRIISYDKRYKQDFIDLNKAWISEMFVIEPHDVEELENIEPAIAAGGQIFFAIDETCEADENGAYPVMACCMIAPQENGDFEIMKFAASDNYRGTGAGTAVLLRCIEYAKEKRVKKIVIVSNHKCVEAVHLYRKHGFTEVPVDKEKFPYERASIAFEMVL